MGVRGGRSWILAATVVCAAFLPSTAAADPGLGDGGPIMPLSQVQAGMNCTGQTVVQGTTISSFNVQVLNVVQGPGRRPMILVRVSGPAVDASGIAEGFSGSPVYCADPHGTLENMGAISAGVGQYGNMVGLATPIQAMLGEPVAPPASAVRLTAWARPLLGPLTVGGLAPSVLGLLERAGQRAGRAVVGAPTSAASGFPVQQLVPGASVAASYSVGDVTIGAIGTVTYRAGSTVYAFGHELDGAGRRSLLLQDAYVYGVIDNPNVSLETSYKLAAPGHVLGTLTSDTPNAVIGSLGAPPAEIPVTVTANDLDTGRTLTLQSQVADESDIGFPLGTSLLDLTAPLEVANAATEIYDGPPANESGRMCLTLRLRESPSPLQFCNRYVGTGAPGDLGLAPPEVALGAGSDVSSALGLLDQEQFATLHVTSIDAQIYAQRGLKEATIVSARAPVRVKAGHEVTVHLLVRMYRGPLKELAFQVRIPHRARGLIFARLGSAALLAPTSAPTPGAQFLSGLSGSLTGGPAPPSPGGAPTSMASLRRAFAAIASYDGLLIEFGRRTPRPVYRDPALLITGSTTLHFLAHH